MKRRSFLAMQAAALGTALFSGFPSLLQASGKPDIAVVQGDPAAATHKAVAMLGGMDCFVKAMLVCTNPLLYVRFFAFFL